MKTRIYLLLTFCMVAVMTTAQERAPQKRCTVTNEREFFDALSSNTHIIIPAGIELNLSKFLNDDMACELLGIKPAEQSSGISFIATYENVDGKEPQIVGMQNITIEGSGKLHSKIVLEPRYAYVINFIKCSNITLRNLKLGHTEAGHCDGGVLLFKECKEITLENCDLYGCGTEGITAIDTHGLTMNKSFIHDCTHSIMTLTNSSNIHFNDCLFARNREYDLISVRAVSRNISFNRCQIHSNEGLLFLLGEEITMTDCIINHKGELGQTAYINETNCRWNAGFAEETAQTEETKNAEAQAATENIDENVTYHQWKGKRGKGEYQLVYAQKGNALIGELKYNDDNGTIIEKVLGMADKDGDIRMQIYSPMEVTMIMREYTANLDGKELELFEAATQTSIKLKRSKDDLRFAMDREPEAYCSPFNKEEIRSFVHSPGEMVGIYQYAMAIDNQTNGKVDLSLSGDNWSTLNADISTMKKGDQLWITTQTTKTDDKVILMEKRVKESDCVLRFEIRFYSDFIIVRTLEQSNCWGNKTIDGIYVKLPSVG